MADTTGKVGFIKVRATPDNNFGLVQVLDASTTPPTAELFFLWFTPAERRTPTGPEWVMRAMQVGLVRDALTHDKSVTVFHDPSSPFVLSLELNAT
jgi:hypothetical protein